MAEYIERIKALQAINEFYHDPKIDIVIRNIPKADVVEVVRCKDCAVPHNKWTGCPKLNGLIPPPDFYCAYGERSKNNA